MAEAPTKRYRFEFLKERAHILTDVKYIKRVVKTFSPEDLRKLEDLVEEYRLRGYWQCAIVKAVKELNSEGFCVTHDSITRMIGCNKCGMEGTGVDPKAFAFRS
jgi:hypothetical protein